MGALAEDLPPQLAIPDGRFSLEAAVEPKCVNVTGRLPNPVRAAKAELASPEDVARMRCLRLGP
jgi:hypothetical protein